MKKSIIIVLAAVLVCSFAQAHAQTKIRAEGMAVINNNRVDIARDKALNAALRSAVEKVAGVMVSSTSEVENARGIQARPAMSPRIIDENGLEIYGSLNVEREYAVQQGMSGYARDLTAAQSNPRVTNNPLSVKGLKTEGAGRSDIVIANTDAEKIRSAGGNQDYLKKCRVMIVLD